MSRNTYGFRIRSQVNTEGTGCRDISMLAEDAIVGTCVDVTTLMIALQGYEGFVTHVMIVPFAV